MDPIQNIRPYKDSTFALLLEAQRLKYEIFYMEQQDLYVEEGEVYAHMQQLQLRDNSQDWFSFLNSSKNKLSALDVILMRKDPPVDASYIYTTQLLELAEAKGVCIINKPQSLRDVNEKLFINWFPQCCASTLVSAASEQLKNFLQQQKDIILKPLDGMGGRGIFRVRENDPNLNIILETMTQQGTTLIMAQRYIPEIKQGDKRIIMFNGEPLPYALARMPAIGETRANLAAGGKGVGIELTDRDRWICEQVGPTLKQKGLFFVGLDVIGDYLTEINVTSPTCLREIDAYFNYNSAGIFFEKLKARISF